MAQNSLKLMGKKRGMTKLFDKDGHMVPCTVIEMEPNVVTQIKTQENDGYTAVQLGFGKVVANGERALNNRVTKPLQGHYKKGGVEPRRFLTESRLDNVETYQLGQEIGADAFAEEAYLDVTATSKGKGFQGTMKLYNYKGGRASHGSSHHREQGSTGMRSSPGRCFKGGKRASQMGNEQVTVQSLKVFLIDKENNLVVLKGAVPGAVGSVVYLTPAVKKIGKKKK